MFLLYVYLETGYLLTMWCWEFEFGWCSRTVEGKARFYYRSWALISCAWLEVLNEGDGWVYFTRVRKNSRSFRVSVLCFFFVGIGGG